MVRHLLFGGMLLAALLAVSPVLAEINAKSFPSNTLPPEDPLYPDGYIAGTALSAFDWVDAPTFVDTTGVLDIEDVGGIHQLAVKLSANGPDPGPLFPSVAAQYDGWGGPNRSNGNLNPGALWYRVDIEKGSGDAMTPLDSFIWTLAYGRQNGANIMTLDGGLGTVRFKSIQTATNSATYNLIDGWNRFVIKNDTAANPNTVVYLNGAEVFSFQAGTGPLVSNNGSSPYRVALERQSRGGTGDHIVGTMRFDNIITANENLIQRPDVNYDTFVDIFDVNEVSSNWALIGAPGIAGDANLDGTVDIFDINMISANWSPSPGGSAAVPEPETCVLLALGLAGLLMVGQKRFGR